MKKHRNHKKYAHISCIYAVILVCIFLILFSGGCKIAEPADQKLKPYTEETEIAFAENSTQKNIEPENNMPENTAKTENTVEGINGDNNESENLESGQETGVIRDDPDKIIFTFTVAGDNRPADDSLPQPPVFIKLLENMKKAYPVFFINTGDIINGKTGNKNVIIRQFNDYLDAVSILGNLNFISCGNHDISSNTSREYFGELVNGSVFKNAELLGKKIISEKNGETGVDDGTADTNGSNNPVRYKNLYYYFEYENVYFVILNAYEEGLWGLVKDGQLSWLEKTLEALKDEDVFVFVHPPVYSYLNPDCITDGSEHVAFSSKKNQDYLRELFKKFKVDAVFSGHEHMYHRESHDGTEYIITGCSGAYPYVSAEEGGFYHFLKIDIKPDSWILTVIDENGQVLSENEIVFN